MDTENKLCSKVEECYHIYGKKMGGSCYSHINGGT